MREFTRNPSKNIVFTSIVAIKPPQIFHDATGNKNRIFCRNVILTALVCATVLAAIYPFLSQSFALSQSISHLQQSPSAAKIISQPQLFAMAPESDFYNTHVLKESQYFNTIFFSTHTLNFTNGELVLEPIALNTIQNQMFVQTPNPVMTIVVDSQVGSSQMSPQNIAVLAQAILQASVDFGGIMIDINASQIMGDGYNNYFLLLKTVREQLHIQSKKLYGHRALNTQISPQILKDESKNVDQYIVTMAEENSKLPVQYTDELKKLISEPGSAPYWVEFQSGQYISGLSLPTTATPISYDIQTIHNYNLNTGVSISQSSDKLLTTVRYDNPAIANQLSIYSDLIGGANKRGVSNIALIEQGIANILLRENSKMVLETIYAHTVFQISGVGKLLKTSQEAQTGLRTLQVNQQNLITASAVVLAPSPTAIEARGLSPKLIALTFDDGPDPEWTPKILDTLKKYNIKATFFVIGEQVQKYPDIARRIVNEGHVIGNHTYSHPHKMNELTTNQIRQEILTTEAVIKQATNTRTTLFRTPYSVSDTLDEAGNPKIIQIATSLGYTLASYDVNTLDWSKPSVDQILRNIQSSVSANSSQILMHDGGGDRSATLEALPKILGYLSEQQLTPVTLQTLANTQYNTPVFSWIDHTKYAFLQQILGALSLLFQVFLAIVVAIGVTRYALIAFGMKKHLHDRKLCIRPYQNYDSLVTILIPAHNESTTITRTVYSLLASSYRRLQIIIIDDQSTDDTYTKVKELSKKYRNIIARTQKNGGKSAALNYGLSFAKGTYVVSIDADTLFDRNAIAKLVTHFYDPRVMGVAGTVHVGNHSVNFLTRAQNLEYTFSQFIDKIAFDAFNAVSVVPGAIGAWRTTHLRKLGGYERDNHAEDTDLTVRTLAKGGIVRFEPEALSYTEVPQDTLSFFKQRLRWQYGTMQVLIKHRQLLFSPRHSVLGMVALPLLGINLLFLLIAPITNIFALSLALEWIFHLLFPGIFVFSGLQVHQATLLAIVALGYLGVELVLTLYAIYLTRGKVKYSTIISLPVVLMWYRLYIWWITSISILKILRGMAPSWGIQKRHGSVLAPLVLLHNSPLLLTTTPK